MRGVGQAQKVRQEPQTPSCPSAASVHTPGCSLLCLRTDLSLKQISVIWLSWLTGELPGFIHLSLPSVLEFQAHAARPTSCIGSGDSDRGLLACIANTLTHTAISLPTPQHISGSYCCPHGLLREGRAVPETLKLYFVGTGAPGVARAWNMVRNIGAGHSFCWYG